MLPWLSLLAIALAQVLLLGRLLHVDPFYDESVYLASLDAVRHGAELGRDVFTSQPPAFYDLLHGLGWVFPDSLPGTRAAIIALSLLAIPGAYLAGRALVAPVAGVLAAALLVVAPPFALDGARIFADTPALALSTLAVGLAACGLGPAAGAVLAFGFLVKFSAVTAAPTVVVLLALMPGVRRRLGGAAAAALLVFAFFALLHRHGLTGIWQDAVAYHESAQGLAKGIPNGLPNGHVLAEFFNPRTPFLWLVVAGAVATLAAPRRVLALWIWPVVAVVFVATHKPLHENHILTLAFAFAPAAGAGLGAGIGRSRRLALPVLLAVVLALAAGYVQRVHAVDATKLPVEPRFVRAAAIVSRLTPPGTYVVSDQPYVVLLAGRRVPPDLVDPADLRFSTGHLTPGAVERDIVRYRVKVVVIGRAFHSRRPLVAWVESHGRRVAGFENIWIYRMRTR